MTWLLVSLLWIHRLVEGLIKVTVMDSYFLDFFSSCEFINERVNWTVVMYLWSRDMFRDHQHCAWSLYLHCILCRTGALQWHGLRQQRSKKVGSQLEGRLPVARGHDVRISGGLCRHHGYQCQGAARWVLLSWCMYEYSVFQCLMDILVDLLVQICT